MRKVEKEEEGSIIVTAPVLTPGKPDCDYQNGETPLTTEQVESIAKSFEQYGVIDEQHLYFDNERIVGEVLESYLLKSLQHYESTGGEELELPEGTWMMTSRVTCPHVIQKIKKGDYTGYSVTVLESEDADKIKVEKSRTLIKDFDKPVAFTVSIVTEPCVSDAKFCRIEGDKSMKEKIMNKFSQVLDLMGENMKKEPERELVSEKGEAPVEDEAKTDKPITQEDFDKFKEEVQGLILDLLKPEEESNISEGLPDKEEKAEKPEEEPKEPEKEEPKPEEKPEPKEEEEEEEEKPAKKSKQLKDKGETEPSIKSTPTIYEALGRDTLGRRI